MATPCCSHVELTAQRQPDSRASTPGSLGEFAVPDEPALSRRTSDRDPSSRREHPQAKPPGRRVDYLHVIRADRRHAAAVHLAVPRPRVPASPQRAGRRDGQPCRPCSSPRSRRGPSCSSESASPTCPCTGRDLWVEGRRHLRDPVNGEDGVSDAERVAGADRGVCRVRHVDLAVVLRAGDRRHRPRGGVQTAGVCVRRRPVIGLRHAVVAVQGQCVYPPVGALVNSTVTGPVKPDGTAAPGVGDSMTGPDASAAEAGEANSHTAPRARTNSGTKRRNT